MTIVNKILTEQSAIMDMMYQLKQQIAEEEMKKSEMEYQLWANTDFSKLGLSNSDQRKAFVKDQLKQITNEIANIKNDLLYAENQFKLLKTKEKFLLEFGLDILDKPE